MDFGSIVATNKEALEIIRNKRDVSRDVFYGLTPELRARAFAISGVEAATVLQRVRDSIAGLARGSVPDGPSGEAKAQTWDTQKAEIVAELEPFLGAGAERRATLLLRTHGFQAFQAANYNTAMVDEDTTHLQYLATEDDRVRDSHLALNGITLPKNDPFWDTHMPPWEWGCRCRVRPMNPDLVAMEKDADAGRNPEDRNMVEGAALEQLRSGTLLREGRRYDVTPPTWKRQEGETAFEWHPDDLRLSVGEISQRYDPEVWDKFAEWARRNMVGKDLTVWNWLVSAPKPRNDRRTMGRIARRTQDRIDEMQLASEGEDEKPH